MSWLRILWQWQTLLIIILLTVYPKLRGSFYYPTLSNIWRPAYFLLENITEAEVKKIPAAPKSSKAKDVHSIDTNFVKTQVDPLAQTITLMVSQSISQKAVPSSWQVATVTHIFKSGSNTLVANYHPISILPIVSKVAEKWIASQLIKHFVKGYTPLHQMRFGFRANHSTQTAKWFYWIG